jgi:hypothetical protein
VTTPGCGATASGSVKAADEWGLPRQDGCAQDGEAGLVRRARRERNPGVPGDRARMALPESRDRSEGSDANSDICGRTAMPTSPALLPDRRQCGCLMHNQRDILGGAFHESRSLP